MKKWIYWIAALLLMQPSLKAQQGNSDNAYKMSLKDVLAEVEHRYQVKLSYPADLVKDKWVTYAEWRYRPDAEQTLRNVLGPLDITVNKTGDKAYQLKDFQYHLKTVEEGKNQLAALSTLYNDTASWQKRKAELRQCMLQSLRLSPMPAKLPSKPIVSNLRRMNGYTIENVAIETMPGLYVCGSLYRPSNPKGKIPVILNPDGHFDKGRYRADCQYRCAMLARMGAMAFSYDLFAWGESLLQFQAVDHRRSLAMTVQALNSMRILDWMLTLKDADPDRAAITGGSGGGSQTMLITALDDRIRLSVPVVMLSCYHSGGCPCESGMPVHLCGDGTNNVEIASMAAPRPQLLISDGKDWTAHVPEIEYPYVKKVYGFYGDAALVKNVHLPQEGHDYGPSKRKAMYEFVAQQFHLDLSKQKDKNGLIDESACTIEEAPAMYVFGRNGENLPANAIKGFEGLEQVFQRNVLRPVMVSQEHR